MIFRRRPEQFLRWTHRYGAGRTWPLDGFVAIVGSESQDSVFLDTRLIEQLHDSPVQLRTVGEETWQVDQPALRQELLDLAAVPGLSEEDVTTIGQAIELVEYEIGNRSGVLIVPPKTKP